MTIDNVRRAFPEIVALEAKRIARQSCRNLGRTFVEYCYLPFMHNQNMRSWIKIENGDYFWNLHKEGKGVLLMSLHLGNGDLGCAALSQAGFPLYLISKEFKLQWLNNLWFGMRARLGTRFIAPEKSSYEILRALKNQAGVIFVQDQFTGPPLGIETTFFGHKTGTAQGLALFSLRTETPILPVFSYRTERGELIVEFCPPIEGSRLAGDRKSQVAELTETCNRWIEKIISQYPTQWMWIHRRWKEFVDRSPK